MKFRNTTERYGAFHQLLHWLIGLGMIGMVFFGLVMEDIAPEGNKYAYYGLHKSIGITILILVAIRLFWRFTNPIPHLPAGMTKWQILLAHGVHLGLYVVMIGMPLSGWMMSSGGGHPVSLWGIPMPSLIEKDKTIGHFFHEAHEIGGWVVLALVGLHVVGAIFHQFVLKDGLMMRMLPCCPKRCCPMSKANKDDGTAE